MATRARISDFALGRAERGQHTLGELVRLGRDHALQRTALLAHLRELAAAGIDHALVTPGQAWDEASFDAVAAILPEVHAIEPQVSR